MGLRREDLKVGGVYISNGSMGVQRTVLYIGETNVFYQYKDTGNGACMGSGEASQGINAFLLSNLIKPKDKRRYWIWTELNDGLPYKISYYLDDEGRRPDGVQWTKKSNLLKKHEDEFIDIEVE